MTLTVSAWLAIALVSNFIPGVVSVVTKRVASATVKQFVAALAAAVTSLLTVNTQADGTVFLTQQTLLLALIVFGSSQLSYLAVWKSHGANSKILPAVGVG